MHPQAAAIFTLTAAVAFGGAQAARSPREHLDPDRWRRVLQRADVDPALFAYPLQTSPEMTRAAAKFAGAGSTIERLRSLQAALFSSSTFPYDYASTETHTAIETFERRRGNCVSFTLMYLAMARSLGIPVWAGLVTDDPTTVREEELVVVNQHMVAVYPRSGDAMVLDFDRTAFQRFQRFALLDDVRIGALFSNNLGAERLREGDFAGAIPYLEAATRLDPDYVEAHANLGVALRHAGRVDDALATYRRALEIDPSRPGTLLNLATLYREQGREDEALSAIAAARRRGATAYALIAQGDLEYVRGHVDEALRRYRHAHRLAPDLADPLVARGRVLMSEGRTAEARRAVAAALAREPEHAGALDLERRISESAGGT